MKMKCRLLMVDPYEVDVKNMINKFSRIDSYRVNGDGVIGDKMKCMVI